MGLKDEVYAAIREDFQEKRDRAFLMDHLRDEKKSRLEKERRLGQQGARPKKERDPYILLSRRYQRIKGDKDSEGKAHYLQEYGAALERNPKLRPGISAQRILDDHTEMENRVFEGKHWKREKYGQLLSRLQSSKPPKFSMKELWVLHEDILLHLLRLEAKALLYDAIDAGKTETGEEKGGSSGRKPRVDRMLELFCHYLQRKGISTLSEAPVRSDKSAAPADDMAEDWQRLYKILNSSGLSEKERRRAKSVWLPVRTDPRTGASIVIIGRSKFSDRGAIGEEVKKHDRNCYCYGFGPMDPVIEDEGIFIRDEEAKKIFPHIHEALTWYERELLPMAAEEVLEENGEVPSGCPDTLKSYFET